MWINVLVDAVVNSLVELQLGYARCTLSALLINVAKESANENRDREIKIHTQVKNKLFI